MTREKKKTAKIFEMVSFIYYFFVRIVNPSIPETKKKKKIVFLYVEAGYYFIF